MKTNHETRQSRFWAMIQYALTGVFLIATALWVGCHSQAEEAERVTSVPVKTAKVERVKMALPIYTSGQLAATAEMKLAFKIGGIVDRIYVDEGAKVRKGQLLAALNLAEIEAQVSQARSGYEKAKRDLERAEKLYADKVATLEQKQDATTALDVAKANLEIAEFNLKHAKIYAPANGKILRRMAERNELVSPGFPVFMFGSTGRDWIVRAGISDRDIVRIKLGDSASVAFDVYPDQRFVATVTEIAEAYDPMSGTFEVELSMRPEGVKLISGFVAKVALYPNDKKPYTLVPIEAIIEGEGSKGYVYIPAVDNKSAKRIPVKIGEIFDAYVGITGGLENISYVITDGAPYLEDGSEIDVRTNNLQQISVNDQKATGKRRQN